jgi:hypothetical protein
VGTFLFNPEYALGVKEVGGGQLAKKSVFHAFA